ncbi:E3 ubiquitin-protein transferase rmnd5a [Mortierella claussenii]|nr:E3 ubiquitin-protein transferase rmnd5a [Mortierella claussenii]
MDSFIKDYDKILKKHRVLETNDPLDRLIAVVNDAKEKIRDGNGEQKCFTLVLGFTSDDCKKQEEKRVLTKTAHIVSIDPASVNTALVALGKSIKTVSNGISEEQKELQSALTKYSKAIDKKFVGDMMGPINPHAFDNKEKILRNTIALHFIRQGNFEVGDAFAKASFLIGPFLEAGLTIPDSIRHQFVEMFDIVAALKEDNFEPALQWAMKHRSELEKRPSTLEFKLHRQRYLQLLEARQIQEAIAYARKHFVYFGNRHTQGKQTGIKKLPDTLTSFIFMLNGKILSWHLSKACLCEL